MSKFLTGFVLLMGMAQAAWSDEVRVNCSFEGSDVKLRLIMPMEMPMIDEKTLSTSYNGTMGFFGLADYSMSQLFKIDMEMGIAGGSSSNLDWIRSSVDHMPIVSIRGSYHGSGTDNRYYEVKLFAILTTKQGFDLHKDTVFSGTARLVTYSNDNNQEKDQVLEQGRMLMGKMECKNILNNLSIFKTELAPAPKN